MQFEFNDQIKKKTDEELKHIFIHARDFNPEFVRLAEEELSVRNINLDISQRLKDKADYSSSKLLAEGKPGSPLYIFLCFVLALFGGVIAIIAGYIYGHSKTTDREGKNFYVYNEQTRQLGEFMMWGYRRNILFRIKRRIIGIEFNEIKPQYLSISKRHISLKPNFLLREFQPVLPKKIRCNF